MLPSSCGGLGSLAVGYATSGRRDVFSEVLCTLQEQSVMPDRVIVCAAVESDFDHVAARNLPFPVDVVRSKKGLTLQRNAILSSAHKFDLIVFFDDDFVPSKDYLFEVKKCFENDDVLGITGQIIADGAIGPGFTMQHAIDLMRNSEPLSTDKSYLIHNVYGCNMAFRMNEIIKRKMEFDEDLPLYGWLEDVDFSRRLSSSAGIVLNERMKGVHLGAKTGKQSGVKFGYSQVANPLHIWRKGQTSYLWLARTITRNVAANLIRSLNPEPWVDRHGRLLGNFMGVMDWLNGRISPLNILDNERKWFGS